MEGLGISWLNTRWRWWSDLNHVSNDQTIKNKVSSLTSTTHKASDTKFNQYKNEIRKGNTENRERKNLNCQPKRNRRNCIKPGNWKTSCNRKKLLNLQRGNDLKISWECCCGWCGCGYVLFRSPRDEGYRGVLCCAVMFGRLLTVVFSRLWIVKLIQGGWSLACYVLGSVIISSPPSRKRFLAKPYLLIFDILGERS